MIWLPDIATTIGFGLAAAFFLSASAIRPKAVLIPVMNTGKRVDPFLYPR